MTCLNAALTITITEIESSTNRITAAAQTGIKLRTERTFDSWWNVSVCIFAFLGNGANKIVL